MPGNTKDIEGDGTLGCPRPQKPPSRLARKLVGHGNQGVVRTTITCLANMYRTAARIERHGLAELVTGTKTIPWPTVGTILAAPGQRHE